MKIFLLSILMAVNFLSNAQLRLISYPEASPTNNKNTTATRQQLFPIIGNSIARGTSSDGAGPTPPTGTVYEWDGTIVKAVLSSDLDDAGNGSAWPRFGIDYNDSVDVKPVFSNSGFSGSYFSSTTGDGGNNWSTTGNLYGPFVTKANAGLAAIGAAKPRGIMFELGINDARSSTALSTIQADVISLFNRLEADFPGTRIYVTNIGRHETAISNARIDAIRGYVQTEIDARANVLLIYDLRIIATDHPELYNPDLVHLLQAGNNFWGTKMATYLSRN